MVQLQMIILYSKKDANSPAPEPGRKREKKQHSTNNVANIKMKEAGNLNGKLSFTDILGLKWIIENREQFVCQVCIKNIGFCFQSKFLKNFFANLKTRFSKDSIEKLGSNKETCFYLLYSKSPLERTPLGNDQTVFSS
ncbi:hypothetical protein HELRODRAFT_172689 [Helobdella robusta]|uniref:Uncharacterized protein n=1 Tax=Helobdella robusta TaxID=6412 RepID=T1F5S6_HELRO|nr:hypothetical protein HELRODRAFT_172689 [Helobdella robusta]ESO04328.1 hypothetical protein HELRODRAFT_172689 [Helobdella robusta]